MKMCIAKDIVETEKILTNSKFRRLQGAENNVKES